MPTDHDGRNGGDPMTDPTRRVRFRQPPPLPLRPTGDDLARYYANLVAQLVPVVQGFDAAIERIEAAVLVSSGAAHAAKQGVDGLTSVLEKLTSAMGKLEARLAPGGEVEQRAQQASGVALEQVAAAAEQLEEVAEKLQAHQSGGHDVITPNRLELALLRQKYEQTQAELLKRASAHNEQTVDAKALAKERRDRFWAVAAPVIASVITGVGLITLAYFVGRAHTP